MKEKLLKIIEESFYSTKNSAKKLTLSNYYNAVQEQDEKSIDYEWYYKQLREFGFDVTTGNEMKLLGY